MSEADAPSVCILRISDEKTLQLLHLYRQEECLWNTQHESYKDQAQRKFAAEKIANLMNIPNFGPRQVIMKFKNLRNAYSQELKKMATKDALGVTYKPSVFWFNKIAFVRPHLQKSHKALKSRRQPTVKPPNLVFHVVGTEKWLQLNPPKETYVFHKADVVSESDSCNSQKKRMLENDIANTCTKIQKVESDSNSDELNVVETEPQASQTERTSDNIIQFEKFVKDYVEEQQKPVIETVKELSSNVRALSSRDDDVFEHFGKYVAGLLRVLPYKKALEVQPQIVSLLSAAGLENDQVEEKDTVFESALVKEEMYETD